MVSYIGRGYQSIEPSFVVFSGHKKRGRLKSQQPEHEPAPICDPSAYKPRVGWGEGKIATTPSCQAQIFNLFFFERQDTNCYSYGMLVLQTEAYGKTKT